MSVNTESKECVFILDWDNTLFSTAYLKGNGFQFDFYFDKNKVELRDVNVIDRYLIKDISSLEEVQYTLNIGID